MATAALASQDADYIKAARELFAENNEKIKELMEEQMHILEEVPEASQDEPEKK
jgi:hypothetical protein